MSPTSKKNLQTWGFGCLGKQEQVYYKGEGEKDNSLRNPKASRRCDHGQLRGHDFEKGF
jgi:hypothetical protein